jgi:diguanylate cyclase (GGDEF)-like protein
LFVVIRCLHACVWIFVCAAGLIAAAQPVQAASAALSFRLLDCRAVDCPATPVANAAQRDREMPSGDQRGRDGLLWFAVVPPDADAVPLAAGWHLLVDNVRFDRMVVEIATADDVIRIDRAPGGLGDAIAMGNYLRFDVPVDGAKVQAIRIGYQGLDSPLLMRSVKAVDDAGLQSSDQRWWQIVMLATGVLLSALAYNLFLLTWLPTRFQPWYVLWAVSALFYMLTWTGALSALWPPLTGPPANRLYIVLLGPMMLAGQFFFFAVIEPGRIPAPLVAAGRVTGWAAFAAAIAASADTLLPAGPTDLALNLAMVSGIMVLFASAWVAATKGSRIVWFYLGGWLPALLMVLLRLARNFGFVGQTTTVDQAGFLAVAWEAVVLGMAIADRFRTLRRQADAAEAERETLRRVANTDPLTGLGNRALLHERLGEAARPPGGIDVVVVDIDYLKQANDMAGHDGGDALIVAVANRLAAAAGDPSRVMRVGGDEFVILLEGAARERLAVLREMLALSAGSTVRYGGYVLKLSVCAGHAASDDPAVSLEMLQKQADLALYWAKAAGRGCWFSFDTAMGADAAARAQRRTDAEIALSRGEFRVHYRRLCRLDYSLFARQAYLVWHHPQMGEVTGTALADVMADNRIAARLHDHLLRRALAEAARRRHAGFGEDRVALALPLERLQGPGAASHLLDQLSSVGLPPDALIVEVNAAKIDHRAHASVIACLECLRDVGVHIAIDQFGTGAASLIQLRDMPADMVWLDRDLVANLAESTASQHVVRAIVDLAHGLGKQVMAPCVDCENQALLLKSLRCDLGEGALFGSADNEIRLAASGGRVAFVLR